MEKHELKNRVGEIERCLAKALDFAFKENRNGRAYEWIARAYRMTDTLKIILAAEERENK